MWFTPNTLDDYGYVKGHYERRVARERKRKESGYYKAARKVNCLECGKEFTRLRKSGLYCTPRCGDNHRRKEKSKELYLPKPCLNCGIVFKPDRPRLNYCKYSCYRADYRKRKKVAGESYT